MINLVKLGQTSDQKRNVLIMRMTLMLTLVCMYCSNASIAYAGTNYGENMGKWFLGQMFWIFIAVMLCIVAFSAIKRAYTAAIIVFVVGCVIGFLIRNPGKIETIGNSLGSIFGF